MATEEITITGTTEGPYAEILTPEAIAFVAALDREFGARRVQLLERRRRRRAARTTELDFLPSTQHIRDDPSWRVAPPAPDLTDRRVEITGPPERKMTVNALNSGAKVWMADFEDATSPTWENVVLGQLYLRDALDGTLDFTAADGREYKVNGWIPTIMVRPRGWHLPECCSTSACTCSTAASGNSTGVADPTSTCRSSSRTSRPGCGTTCSCSLRSTWAYRVARSGPPC